MIFADDFSGKPHSAGGSWNPTLQKMKGRHPLRDSASGRLGPRPERVREFSPYTGFRGRASPLQLATKRDVELDFWVAQWFTAAINGLPLAPDARSFRALCEKRVGDGDHRCTL